MKKTYIGTALDGPDCHEFGILAATKGTSKSALLKLLALDFITKHRAAVGRKSAMSAKKKASAAA